MANLHTDKGKRAREMYELYEDGATLEEVGICFGGITRERVRQIFRDAGLATRSVGQTAGVRPSAPKLGTNLYSDAELIDCLQRAHRALGGVLTLTAYNEFAQGQSFPDGRPWPTHQTPSHRFGTWTKALQAAGLPSKPSTGRPKVFEQADCINAVRSVVRELGHVPSAAAYDKSARTSAGTLPSLKTVRNHCGTWANALQMAGM